jgi:transcriptional regulator with PAS, ATPase and Fis domain
VAGTRGEIVRIDALAPRGYGPYAAGLSLAGLSPALLDLGARIESLARSRAPVLVQGETGSGKELVARALHARSPRASAPFIPHNFASIPDSLVESELFGHVRGAFTGAHADRAGLFELASTGTLFLDEIGDASGSVQSRLLRALQEGEVRRVGEGRARRVDVRVIAATHRDLAALVRGGRFREDLYYRLHVLPLRVPPLRERREDVPLLLAHALERLSRREGFRVWGVRRSVLEALMAHDWPGNVRELEGAVLRAVHASGSDGVMERDGLGEGSLGADAGRVREERDDLRGRTRAYEAALIAAALSAHDGNRTRAARALGLTRQGLWKKLRRLRASERSGTSRDD